VAEHTKAELDAMTDKAAAIARAEPLGGLRAEYAGIVAGALAAQFPGVPGLDRIVIACAHHMSALGANDVSGAVLVHVLAEAGLRIGGAATGD
jgi:hypothetical protein